MSIQTKQNIEHAFHRAARAGLLRAPGDVCNIEPLERGKLGEQPAGNLLVITISSFVFRLLTIFRIAENPVNRAYYVRGSADRTLDEAFSEVANMCCGALNRELSGSFAHLAMSIPYALSGQCIAFLGELKPQYSPSYAITINDSVRLQVTLCMCCSAPVDVAASTAAVAVAENGGELELF
jgi:hypothetical protein